LKEFLVFYYIMRQELIEAFCCENEIQIKEK